MDPVSHPPTTCTNPTSEETDEASPAAIHPASLFERIELTLEEVRQRINLMEYAAEGRFDDELDVWTFRLPLGDLIKCMDKIDDAVEELRSVSFAAAVAELRRVSGGVA